MRIACAFGVPAADEHAEEHARDVRVEDRGALAEREAQDRAGGVRADPLERRAASPRRPAARRRSARPTRARSRGAAAAGCCSPAAATSPRRPPRARSASAVERRVLLEPLVVLRQHAIDLRLLQHHLRHEDVIRVRSFAPRQVAPVPPIPVEQTPPEPLTGAQARERELPAAADVDVVWSGMDAADPDPEPSNESPRTLSGVATAIIVSVKIYTRTGDAATRRCSTARASRSLIRAWPPTATSTS